MGENTEDAKPLGKLGKKKSSINHDGASLLQRTIPSIAIPAPPITLVAWASCETDASSTPGYFSK
jgi:hypothetical protein